VTPNTRTPRLHVFTHTHTHTHREELARVRYIRRNTRRGVRDDTLFRAKNWKRSAAIAQVRPDVFAKQPAQQRGARPPPFGATRRRTVFAALAAGVVVVVGSFVVRRPRTGHDDDNGREARGSPKVQYPVRRISAPEPQHENRKCPRVCDRS